LAGVPFLSDRRALRQPDMAERVMALMEKSCAEINRWSIDTPLIELISTSRVGWTAIPGYVRQ
jgi:hypothetical protein